MTKASWRRPSAARLPAWPRPRRRPGPGVESERLTRNLNELLQELRVTQTGVQILTGFLLTLPFTDRFTDARRACSAAPTWRS